MVKKKKKIKENKSKELNIIQAIKKNEQEKHNAAPEVKKIVPENKIDNKISFDQWWMQRAKFIPKQHKKEIIKADFIGRGLKKEETLQQYDEALEKYGIRINK